LIEHSDEAETGRRILTLVLAKQFGVGTGRVGHKGDEKRFGDSHTGGRGSCLPVIAVVMG
jgi:hypothetical protein